MQKRLGVRAVSLGEAAKVAAAGAAKPAEEPDQPGDQEDAKPVKSGED